MKNNISLFLISTLIISSSALSNDGDCEKEVLKTDLLEMATSFQIPNCSSSKQIRGAKLSEEKFHQLCTDCLPRFKESSQVLLSTPQESTPIDLEKVVLNELKRSLSENLMDMIKLRSSFNLNADYAPAQKACDIEEFEKKLDKRKCAQNSHLKDLKNQLAEELGSLLKKNPNSSDKSLLIRNLPDSKCNISEVEVLRARSLGLEEALTPEIIEIFSQLDPLKLTEGMKDLNYPFKSELKAHPLFSQLLSPPENFVSFFQKLNRPVSIDNLRANLYASKGFTSQIIDNISRKCTESFKAYEEIACHPDIKSKKVKLETLKDTEKFVALLPSSSGDFVDVSSPTGLASNEQLQQICNLRTDNPNALNLNSELDKITHWVPSEYRTIPFENYRRDKYDLEIGNFRQSLCKIQSGEEKCETGSLQCELYLLIQKSKDASTQEGHLAISSDQQVNKLLRSFIGSPTGLSESTKSVLIAEGILPMNERGDYTPEVIVPERQAQFIQHQEQKIAGPQVAPPSQSNPLPPSSTRGRGEISANSLSSATYSTGNAPLPSSGASARDLDPLASNKEMQSINDEILRRLSRPGKDPARAVSREEVGKALGETARERGTFISPERKAALTDRIFESLSSNSQEMHPIPDHQRATLDPTESPEEVWRKEQKYRALSGMAGAREVLRAKGDEDSFQIPTDINKKNEVQKKLSKVEITLEENQKGDVSSALTDKMIRNDLDGQKLRELLKAKENFMLELNGKMFKVDYSPRENSFIVSLVNIESQESKVLKRKLEVFLNEIVKKV